MNKYMQIVKMWRQHTHSLIGKKLICKLVYLSYTVFKMNELDFHEENKVNKSQTMLREKMYSITTLI